MPDQNQNLLVTAGVNKAEAQTAIKLLQDMQKAAEGIAIAFKGVGSGGQQQMQSAVVQTRELSNVMMTAERQMSSMSAQMISGRLRRFGMTSSNILGAGNPIQETLRIGSDIAEFKEAIKDLPNIFSQVKTSTVDFAKSFPGIIGKMFDVVSGSPLLGGAARIGEGAVGAISGSTGTMAALGGLATSLGPMLLAAGALTLAFASLSQTLSDGHTQVQKAIAALDEYYKKISSSTEDLLKSENVRLAQQIANAKKERDTLAASVSGTLTTGRDITALPKALFALATTGDVTKKIRDLNDQMGVWQKTIEDNTKALNAQEVIERSRVQRLITQTQAEVSFTEKMQSAAKQSSESLKTRVTDITNSLWALQGGVDTLDKQLASSNNTETFNTLSAQILSYRAQMGDLSREQQTLLDTIIPLVKEREREAKIMDDLTKGIPAMLQAMQGIVAVNEQIAKTTEDRERTDARAAIEGNYKRRIELAQNNEQVLAIEAQMHDTEINMAKAAAKAAEQHSKEIARMDRDFMRSEMDATRRFQREQARAEDQYARERLKTLRDLNERLADIAGEGDVAAFIQAQRDGVRQLRDQAENHDQSVKDSIDQFAQDRADALERFKLQKADSEENYQLQKAEQEKANRETLQAQREQHQKVKLQSKTLEDELAALREQWRIEDEARRRAEEDKAAQDRLDKLKLDLATAQSLTDAYWNQVHAKISSLITSLGGSVGVADPRNGPHVGAAGFASGLDFVPRDNFPAILHKGEAVIPASRNRAGGAGLTIGSITIGAGNGVTVFDVEHALQRFADQLAGTYMNAGRALT